MIGAEVLPGIVAKMRAAHPLIAIELALSNRNENLLLREADIAVRMVRPTQKNLVTRKIGEVPVQLYAHKTYVKRRGLPRTMAELASHDVIGYDAQSPMGLGGLGAQVTRDTFALRTDSDLAQIALLRAGAGIGGLQRQLAARERNLLPVLHGAIKLPLEMWLVVHEDLRTTRRVRLIYDALAAGLTDYVRR